MMSRPAEDKKTYTYGDYLNWPESERWELIGGIPFNMTPASSTNHQIIVGELFRQISTCLLDKDCRPFIAPFDVRLPESEEADDEIITVVRPDISVICDPGKIECGVAGGRRILLSK
jgi:Putative restriction endonuclease